MSIVIVRTVQVIDGYIQELPNLEAAKTLYPMQAGDWENTIELSPHSPKYSNTYFKYREEIVQ